MSAAEVEACVMTALWWLGPAIAMTGAFCGLLVFGLTYTPGPFVFLLWVEDAGGVEGPPILCRFRWSARALKRAIERRHGLVVRVQPVEVS